MSYILKVSPVSAVSGEITMIRGSLKDHSIPIEDCIMQARARVKAVYDEHGKDSSVIDDVTANHVRNFWKRQHRTVHCAGKRHVEPGDSGSAYDQYLTAKHRRRNGLYY